MISLLTLFMVIALVALLDLNKRVDALEQQQKEREEIDQAITKLIEDLTTVLKEEENEPVR